MVSFLPGFGLRRILTHIALALVTAGACWAAHLYVPRAEATFVFMLGFGYVCLAFIAASLLIGQLNLLRQRRNPVSINLRRDVGIWSGITGCLHVVFAIQLRFQGQVLFYFFAQAADGSFRPLLNRFGIANWLGAVATIMLVLLLLTSNTLSLRILKGRRWKLLQRFNYVLAALALIHTLLFQGNGQRQSIFMNVVLLVTLAAVVVQWIGIDVHRHRRR